MAWFPERRGARSGWAFVAFFLGAIILAMAADTVQLRDVDPELDELTGKDLTSVTDVDQALVSEMVEEDGLDVTQDQLDDLYTGTGKSGKRLNTLEKVQDGVYARYDPALAMVAVGITAMVMCLVAGAFLSTPPTGWTPDGWEPSDGGLSLEMTYKTKELLSDRVFIQLWLIMAAGTSVGLMFTYHFQGLGIYFGTNAPEAQTALLLFLMGGAIGAFIAGYLGDGITVPTTMFIFLLIQTLLLLVLIELVENAYHLYWTMGAYGACFGAIMALFPPAAADYFGARGFVRNYGLLLTGMALAAILGIIAVAVLTRNSGNYTTSLFLVTAPTLLGVFLAFVTKDPEKKLRAAARREAMEGELGLAAEEVREKKKSKKKKAKKRKRKKKRGR
jgi:hypothetical protein